jgi:hypothetical protein
LQRAFLDSEVVLESEAVWSKVVRSEERMELNLLKRVDSESEVVLLAEKPVPAYDAKLAYESETLSLLFN